MVNVGQRANLYRTINRLQEGGLIAVRRTERDQQFPERTVYELTDDGRRTAREWLTEMLSTPRNEFPDFPRRAVLRDGLEPRTALQDVLEHRVPRRSREQLSLLDQELGKYSPRPFPEWR